MADLAAQTISRAGLAPAMAAADAAGDKFINGGQEFVLIKNANATTARTVTLDITAAIDGQPVTDRQVSIPANSQKHIGPFPPSSYNDAQGKVALSYDVNTDLTLAVLKLGT